MDIGGGLGEVFRAAEVAPVEFVGAEGNDFFPGGGQAEIAVDDGEGAAFREEGEEARGDDVNSCEGERLQGRGGTHDFVGARFPFGGQRGDCFRRREVGGKTCVVGRRELLARRIFCEIRAFA